MLESTQPTKTDKQEMDGRVPMLKPGPLDKVRDGCGIASSGVAQKDPPSTQKSNKFSSLSRREITNRYIRGF